MHTTATNGDDELLEHSTLQRHGDMSVLPEISLQGELMAKYGPKANHVDDALRPSSGSAGLRRAEESVRVASSQTPSGIDVG